MPLGAAQLAALPLELVHADRGQGRRGVVTGGVMVDLVDRHRGVDDFGLDHLLLDHRLDGLVDMVVEMLALYGRGAALGVGGLGHDTLIVQLRSFGFQSLLSLPLVAVVKLAVLGPNHSVLVLLGQDLGVLDGLDGAVVMVLVDLLLDGSLDFFMLSGLDSLVLHRRSNTLMHGRIVMTSLGLDVVDGLLGSVHGELSDGESSVGVNAGI
jgi:hypothetical protein